MPINVLYIIDRLDRGGTERQLEALVSGLDRTRFQPHICTLKPSLGLFEEFNCPKEELALERLFKPAAFSEFKRLIRLVRSWNIDLVQTFFQDPFVVGALIKRFHPSVLIGSFRDMGFWRMPIENLKMRFCYPAFDGFIANSKAVKNHFEAKDGISPGRIKVIYNGYAGSWGIGSDKPPIDSGVPIVGIVANFNRRVKRLEDFLKAAELVLARVPAMHFMVIGHVGELYCELADEAERKMDGNIEFIGSVPDPVDYIRGFEIGVITSETEGFCNAILEYMACGIPVVVTDAGGNQEMVEDGVNGFRVPVGDAEAMATRILELHENSGMRLAMSKRNKEKVEKSYAMYRMIRKHEAYYLKLMTRFHGSCRMR